MSKGDHIYIHPENSVIHHGINCGDGTVIHYRGKQSGGRITRTTYRKFSQGEQVYVGTYSYKFSRDEVVKRARKRLHESDYNVVFNNCGHFATYCTTDKAYSEQVENVISNGGSVIASGGTAVLLGAVTTRVAAPSVLVLMGFTTVARLPVATVVVGGAALAGSAVYGISKMIFKR